jgi:hypothetical protein
MPQGTSVPDQRQSVLDMRDSTLHVLDRVELRYGV